MVTIMVRFTLDSYTENVPSVIDDRLGQFDPENCAEYVKLSSLLTGEIVYFSIPMLSTVQV